MNKFKSWFTHYAGILCMHISCICSKGNEGVGIISLEFALIKELNYEHLKALPQLSCDLDLSCLPQPQFGRYVKTYFTVPVIQHRWRYRRAGTSADIKRD
jgi:hypothetical protein